MNTISDWMVEEIKAHGIDVQNVEELSMWLIVTLIKFTVRKEETN